MNPNKRQAAIFIDKDGTLIEDVPYNVDPDCIQLTAGAVEGLALLHAAGHALIVTAVPQPDDSIFTVPVASCPSHATVLCGGPGSTDA